MGADPTILFTIVALSQKRMSPCVARSVFETLLVQPLIGFARFMEIEKLLSKVVIREVLRLQWKTYAEPCAPIAPLLCLQSKLLPPPVAS